MSLKHPQHASNGCIKIQMAAQVIAIGQAITRTIIQHKAKMGLDAMTYVDSCAKKESMVRGAWNEKEKWEVKSVWGVGGGGEAGKRGPQQES